MQTTNATKGAIDELVAGVPTKAVADHCGTSMRMIEQNHSKFIPEDRKRYADTGAPKLRIGDDAC